MNSIIRKDCQLCYKLMVASDIGDLQCGHFICPSCYCKLKENKTNHCVFCFKNLKRVRKCKKNN